MLFVWTIINDCSRISCQPASGVYTVQFDIPEKTLGFPHSTDQVYEDKNKYNLYKQNHLNYTNVSKRVLRLGILASQYVFLACPNILSFRDNYQNVSYKTLSYLLQ